MLRVLRIAIAAGILSLPAGARREVHANETGGYRGIPWGAPCDDAIARLEGSGVEFRTFNSSTQRQGFADHASSGGPLGNGEWYVSNAWCPGNDTAITAAFGSGSPYAEAAGLAGDVEFTAYCRDGKFAGVQMSAEASSLEGKRAAQLLKRTAGPSITTKRNVGALHSVLKPKGDAARFLTVAKNLAYGFESVTYSVVDWAEWIALREAYLRCSRDNAENEKRQDIRSRRQERSAIE